MTAVLVAIVAALTLTGCARQVLTGVTQQELSDGQEPYFDVGGITYQIQSSRQLNPFSDDVEYFGGLKTAQSIPGSEFWFGVFLWAKNQNVKTTPTASKFILTDSAGQSFTPTPLSASLNPFAWTSESLEQNTIQPNPDSIAASGTNDGDLILFELPESAYQNRPLTLHIYAPGSTTSSDVSLDL